jgi:hypothetical protein
MASRTNSLLPFIHDKKTEHGSENSKAEIPEARIT